MMSAADLVVVPSLFDSYPNVILEAFHVGTPVVGSRVGGIPDMLRYPELLFPPADAQAIADRLVLLHDDAAAFKRVQTLCRQRRSYFDFDWAGEFETVLQQIAGGPV
jgi:glycosyltransferase involved in cell wall biosynthesis